MGRPAELYSAEERQREREKEGGEMRGVRRLRVRVLAESLPPHYSRRLALPLVWEE